MDRTMGAHGLSSDVVDAALRTARATVRRPYQVLSEPEVATVLQAADNPRDAALLAVLLGAGLRVSESSGLDVADVVVDQDGDTALYVRQGKGRKDRVVPIQPEPASSAPPPWTAPRSCPSSTWWWFRCTTLSPSW